MADITQTQITEIDLKLTETLARVETKVDGLIKVTGELEYHQREINGTVGEHQIILADLRNFKAAIETSAAEKAKAAADRSNAIWGTLYSVAGTLLTLVIAWIVYHYFRINLQNPS